MWMQFIESILLVSVTLNYWTVVCSSVVVKSDLMIVQKISAHVLNKTIIHNSFPKIIFADAKRIYDMYVHSYNESAL